MRIILFGINGQLGSPLYEALKKRGHDVAGFSHADLDVTDEIAVRKTVERIAPDAVVNCVAYNAVDRAEDEEELCRKVNTDAVGYMASAAESVHASFMTFSSDYVFDGSGTEPIPEDAPVGPLNIYGRSKADAERIAFEKCSRAFVVRVSWLYSDRENNFVATMRKLAQNHSSLRVVCDQIGSPTYAPDIVEILCNMLESEEYGIYNLSNEGFCSRYELACKIFELAGFDVQVVPVKTSEFESKAQRPLNSRLSKKKIYKNGFGNIPSWEESLKKCIEKW